MAYERMGLKDFDENNPFAAKHVDHIEDGIIQNETDIKSKADQSDLDALSNDVAKKADQSDVDALSDDVAALNADLTDLDFMNQSGTRINSGADLDDYTDPGKYYINSASDAREISNCPITNAGCTIICMKMQNGARRMQFMFEPLNCQFYIRGSNETTWGSWYSVPLTAVTSLGTTDTGDDLETVGKPDDIED